MHNRITCYLLTVSFFLSFCITVYSNQQVPDSIKYQKADTLQVPDSIKKQGVDTLKKQLPDSLIFNRKNFSAEEITRGERLFYGLAYASNKAVNCAHCHNTRVSDTLNWNPDALVISTKYKQKSALVLSNILLAPKGKKMAEVHRGFQLNPEDIVFIKAFMDKFANTGLSPDKPVITNLLLFISAVILFLFSAIDLIITRKIKRKWIHFVILSATTIYIASTLVIDAIMLGRTPDYSPDQPIKFSHFVHAGQNKTDCIYCHSYAQISKTAGIPPVNVCMNCHLLVRSGTRSGETEIAKIINALDNSTPIEWVKVHNLPDYVFFSHSQHVGQGKIECKVCHGDTEKMNIIVQVSDLSMGWCVACHRTRNINFQANSFYSDYKETADRIKSGITDSVTIDLLGGTNCMKCHY